jgi:RND family efflux transporter MFP subunit
MLWSAGASLNSRFRQLCLILPLMMLISCQNEEASSLSPSALAPVTAVRVSPISLGQQPELLHFASVTRVRQRATLTFQVNGVLRERNAELGQLIEQGQLLATIHNPALEPARDAAAASLAQLQTEADQAERELLRLETLYQRDIVPLQDLEQQRSRVESLQAALNTARANLSQAQRLLEETRLMAPFSGSVESVIREPGEFV